MKALKPEYIKHKNKYIKISFYQKSYYPNRVIAKAKGYGSIEMGNKELAFKRMKNKIKH